MMELPQRLSVKVFATGASAGPKDALLVFHRWIQTQRLDELLIDVTDYSHVHHGPGVILIGHGADYGLDQEEGRLGLKYTLKSRAPATTPTTLVELVVRACRATLVACRHLEHELPLRGKI